MLVNIYAFCLVACHSLNFTELPAEIVSHNIWSSLSIIDKMKSIIRVNRMALNHFHLYYRDELKLYKQLIHEIRKPNDSSLFEIERVSKKLQFSEIWSLMLPDTLREVSNHSWQKMELLLEAMRMHTIGVSELSRLHFLRNFSSSELDILIFASCALLQYYLIDDEMNANKLRYFANLDIEDYPWLYYVLSDGQTFHKHWAIYMSYLYEVTYDLGYKNANIPKLNCVYKHDLCCDEEDNVKRNNLRDLMKFGLTVWSRDNINDLRLDFFNQHSDNCSYHFFSLVLEANAMTKQLSHRRGSAFKFELQFMSKFVLDIAYKYSVNISLDIDNQWQYRAFSDTMTLLENYRYQNFEQREYDLCEKLSHLILKIECMVGCKFLIMEYLAESPINGAYINQTIRILRQYQPKLSETYLTELLRRIILKRAEMWFPANKSKAITEIKKLAHDDLYHKDTLKVLLESTQKKFAFQMIQILCRIRKDWALSSALKVMICNNFDAHV